MWRELRLRALAEDPYAFGSTLAQWSGSNDTEARWRRRLASVPLNLVASIDDRAIGMASATSPVDGETEIISMWVAPEARTQGVGAALVGSIVTWARQHGVLRVGLDVRVGNVAAVALYESCGFVDVGPSPNSGPDTPERRMVRRLPPKVGP